MRLNAPIGLTRHRAAAAGLQAPRQLLLAVHLILGIVDVEHDPALHIVGCKHRWAPLSGSRSTASLNVGPARSTSQSLASR